MYRYWRGFRSRRVPPLILPHVSREFRVTRGLARSLPLCDHDAEELVITSQFEEECQPESTHSVEHTVSIVAKIVSSGLCLRVREIRYAPVANDRGCPDRRVDRVTADQGDFRRGITDPLAAMAAAQAAVHGPDRRGV